MKKIAIILICFFTAANIAAAQTLFTYGKHAVSKDEFLEVYNKNADTAGNRPEKLKAYLNLYTNFRLKLQAAYDEQVQAKPELAAETENFKTQLTDNIINQQANLAALVHEAFLRSQKDIWVQQVFVQFTGDDTSAAYATISTALNALRAGKKFEEISAKYSNDQAVKAVNGNVGYITVFTLPYSIENIIYNLQPGNFSAIYKSGSGYHIFKNAGERPAVGRRKMQQLLFATQPFYSKEQMEKMQQQADSVYMLLQNHTSFADFLPIYGHNNDNTNPDNTIEVKAGDYSYDFEKEVFGLKKAGDISKPFKTSYGYHIIKLVKILPVATNEDDVNLNAYLQDQVQNTGRLDAAKSALVKKWLSVIGFKENVYSKNDLWVYTDSALKNTGKLFASYKKIKPETILFQFTGKKFTVKDWVEYLQARNIYARKVTSGYGRQMDDFIQVNGNNYYRAHIEDFNPSVAEQLKEFNEANLLFYVMDKHVWSKAASDTNGLKKYYALHKNNYKWQQSVVAIIISAPERAVADSIAMKLKRNPAAWKEIVAAYKDIYADSSRFDIKQLPVQAKVEYRKGFQTKPESNDEGNVYTFMHVLSFDDKPEQKSFEEARGDLINDYQQEIEQGWLKSLNEKYPVHLNDSVLKTLH